MGWIETYRGTVYRWELDNVDHFTVAFYFQRFADATAWLLKHGAEYGLCPIYRNEPWHYELRPEAIDDGCPSMYANPAHDPRMQPGTPTEGVRRVMRWASTASGSGDDRRTTR